MQVRQYHFHDGKWFPNLPKDDKSQLLLSFGGREFPQNSHLRKQIKIAFPLADNIGCNTSGEILSTEVYDESLVLTQETTLLLKSSFAKLT